jgi:hypothetical protein
MPFRLRNSAPRFYEGWAGRMVNLSDEATTAVPQLQRGQKTLVSQNDDLASSALAQRIHPAAREPRPSLELGESRLCARRRGNRGRKTTKPRACTCLSRCGIRKPASVLPKRNSLLYKRRRSPSLPRKTTGERDGIATLRRAVGTRIVTGNTANATTTTRRIVLAGRLDPRDVSAVGLVVVILLVVPLDMTTTIEADGTTVPIGIETMTGIVVGTVVMIEMIEGEMEIESVTGTAAIDLEMRDTAAHGTRLGMTETETVIVIATLVGVVVMIRGRMFWRGGLKSIRVFVHDRLQLLWSDISPPSRYFTKRLNQKRDTLNNQNTCRWLWPTNTFHDMTHCSIL